MTRLYLRLFLAFWLVVSLTIASVLVVNLQLERLQQDERSESMRATRMRDALVGAANRALQDGGEPALRDWAARADRRFRRLDVWIFDDTGRELRERAPPRAMRGLLRRWEHGEELDTVTRRGRHAQVLSDGAQDYLLIIAAQRPPVLLRVLGPIGPWGLLLLAISISGLVCLLLARHLSRPIRELRVAGEALGSGHLDARVAPRWTARRDELGDLARDFNHMAGRIQSLLDGQRQLLRDVSHELRSPLSRIQVAMTLARDSDDANVRDAYLARIEDEMERLDALIGQILTYSRLTDDEAPRRERTDLRELLEQIADAASLEGGPHEVTVHLDAAETLSVDAEPELLHSAVENVVRNAVRHAPDRSEVEITARAATDGGCEIVVGDRGPGVAPEMLERMFEPFVRLSRDRSEASPGGGVGLAITRRAVERHGGRVTAVNRDGGGLEIRLWLPPRAA